MTNKPNDRVKKTVNSIMNLTKLKRIKKDKGDIVSNTSQSIENLGTPEENIKKVDIHKMPTNNMKAGFGSITFRLIASYLIPIILIVVLGIVSYNQASKAIIEKAESSTTDTVTALGSYLTTNFDNAANEALEYLTLDSNGDYYFDQDLDVDNLSADARLVFSTFEKKVKSTVATEKKLIYDLYVFGEVGNGLNYKGLSMDNTMFSKFIATEQGNRWYESKARIGWDSYHPFFDEKIKASSVVDQMQYAITMYRKSINNNLFIIVDIKQSLIDETIARLNFGEGSWTAFIAPGGKQSLFNGYKEVSNTEEPTAVASEGDAAIVVEETTETEVVEEIVVDEANQINFTEFSFYDEAIASDTSSGFSYEDYKGEKYLFAWSKVYADGVETGALICSLMPKSVILSEVEGIRVLTIVIVLLATVIALIAGGFISATLSSAIKKSIKSLNKAAAGDLTVTFEVHRKDEFGILARGLTNMLSGMRHLIQEMNEVGDTVTNSAVEVSTGTKMILASTKDISLAIEEIEGGVTQQASDTEQCLVQMSNLAVRINDVYDSTHKIEIIADNTKTIIGQGIVVVDELNEKTKATTDITKTVIGGIEELEVQSRSIGSIVNVINEIASQTNLLSLNASIEAARAGEAGRGFAVVAEEIRKLADQSMNSAKKIGHIIDDIQTKTKQTVVSAKKAEDIVGSQANALSKTITAFQDINAHVEQLVSNLDFISIGVKGIETAKADTLDAIQNISAISEETASSSQEVGATAIEQIEAVSRLNDAATDLATNAKKLDEAISIFKIV